MNKVDITLLLSSVLWGLSWIPLKFLEGQGVEGLLLICVAYGTMVLLIFPWAWTARSQIKGHALPVFGIFIAGGLANLCFNLAVIYGDVVRVMVLFYLLPVWGVLGGRFILKEFTDSWRYLGVVLAVCGAFILLGGVDIFYAPPNWVDLLAILSGLFFAINNMMFRAVEELALPVKLGALFLGCFCLSGLLLLLSIQALGSFNPKVILWVVLYGMVWLFWANLGSQWAVTKMPAGRSSIIIIMELLAAVLSAIAIGGEKITWAVLIGGCLVLSATAIEIVRDRKSAVKLSAGL